MSKNPLSLDTNAETGKAKSPNVGNYGESRNFGR